MSCRRLDDIEERLERIEEILEQVETFRALLEKGSSPAAERKAPDAADSPEARIADLESQVRKLLFTQEWAGLSEEERHRRVNRAVDNMAEKARAEAYGFLAAQRRALCRNGWSVEQAKLVEKKARGRVLTPAQSLNDVLSESANTGGGAE
jgi:hypothetical protein